MFYDNRAEAIEQEITAALGEYADQHDIDAIADEALVQVTENGVYGWKPALGHDEFWAVVERHAL